MPSRLLRRLFPALLLLPVLLAPRALEAQATGYVPADHWSLGAVDRLHALGLAPAGTYRGERSRTIGEVWQVLRAAADSSALAAPYLRRFEAEFPERGAGALRLEHVHAGVGAGMLDGDARPGRYEEWFEQGWTGATPRRDGTAVAGEVSASAGLGRYLAVGGSAHGGADRTRIDQAYATLRFGALGLWGGRRRPGYGPGTSGIPLTGAVPLDGGGLHVEPFVLPWVLRHLGPVRFDLAVLKPPPNGPMESPWMAVTRGAIEPHPRFGVGVSRGGMAANIGDSDLNFREVLYLVIGKHIRGSQYDNQVASVDAWFRPPLGALPLVLYVDWGFEDSAGSWKDVPGVVAGLEVAAVPGVEWLALQLERTSFGQSGNGNPPWYRHPLGFHEGWTARGQLLGHPLGGHGEEWLVEARSTTHEAGLQLAARAFTRRRDVENVYAPQREGRSNGLAVRADVALVRGLALRLEGSHEDGAGWSRSDALALLRFYLPR